jgi:hypothetical protein
MTIWSNILHWSNSIITNCLEPTKVETRGHPKNTGQSRENFLSEKYTKKQARSFTIEKNIQIRQTITNCFKHT